MGIDKTGIAERSWKDAWWGLSIVEVLESSEVINRMFKEAEIEVERR